MGFTNIIKNFLNIATRKDIEQLQETINTQEILLKDMGGPTTFISSIGREAKKVEDPQGLGKRRVSVRQLQLLYLNNQFIFRGVNVRADELITRGFKIIGGDEDGVKACNELIEASGGDNLFWQFSVNTDVAGDGYLEKIYNKAKNKILLVKHINPINFGFLTAEDDTSKILVNDAGVPKAYMQIITDKDAKEQRKEIPKDRIAHLKFNTFGDEFNGISTLQPVYNTSIRLMNMEHAAAEASVKSANPVWIVKTESKSPADLATWAKVMGKVSAKEVVFLPKGVDTKLESPGPQNFSDYSAYFLDAVVAALGVPKSILTGGTGTDSSNRSTIVTLSKHLQSVIRANQRYVEELFNKIFAEYGKLAGFVPPKLKFNDIAEDADRNGQRAVELHQAGLVTLFEARTMVGLETTPSILAKLEKENSGNNGSLTPVPKLDPDKELKKDDMDTFFPPTSGSVQGSQKNIKKEQKLNPEVPSVR